MEIISQQYFIPQKRSIHTREKNESRQGMGAGPFWEMGSEK